MDYKEVKKKCLPEDIFETVGIKITISPFYQESSTDLGYRIKSFEIDMDKTTDTKGDLCKGLMKHCALVNEQIVKDLPMKWKVFYLYKELFQKIASDSSLGIFNYFRGQAKNWDTIPGIFRPDTSESFIEDFEKIYKRISVEFPSEIEHIEINKDVDVQRNRARQLAMLQHYGLRTSLLDLTRNPYIALLFMVSDSSKKDFSSGVIEAYSIDEDLHETNNIFISIEKEDHNKRLKAQDGAFLYYDKLAYLDSKNISKIPRVIIELCYSTEDFTSDILTKKNDVGSALSTLPPNASPDLLNAFHKELKSLEDELESIEQNIDKSGIFTMIHDEIKTKLNEYYYFEESLFPDLYKYIEFLQPRYLTNNNSVKLNTKI